MTTISNTKAQTPPRLTPEAELALIQKTLKHPARDDVTYWLDTGDKLLNSVLGSETRGIPYGKLIEAAGWESHGKTALLYRVAGVAQKDGARIGIWDLEEAWDPEWARRCGIDPENVIIFRPVVGFFGNEKKKRPITAEEQAEQVEMWLDRCNEQNPGGRIFLGVDSIAAIATAEEEEASISTQNMRTKISTASFLSFLLRRWQKRAASYNAIVFVVNQIRVKPGVAFGCFLGSSPVNFSDGSKKRIEEVVKGKIKDFVVSYDLKAKKFVDSRISGFFENGDLTDKEYWLKFVVEGVGGDSGRQGRTCFSCTENHLILKADHTEAPARELKKGDLLVSFYDQRIGENGYRRDLVYGTLLGDGALIAWPRDKNRKTNRIVLQNSEQPKYLRWKLKKMAWLGFKRLYPGLRKSPVVNAYNSEFLYELGLLTKKFYKRLGADRCYRGIPEDLRELTPLMAAVWFMDDGHYYQERETASISIRRFARPGYLDNAFRAEDLVSKFVGTGGVWLVGNGASLRMDRFAFENFCKKIARFVPVCMQYKLLKQFRGKYVDFEVKAPDSRKEIPVTILSIEKRKGGGYRDSRYDLRVNGTGHYLMGGGNGVVVHNSPEYTPGGNALRFYCAIRVKVRRKAGKVLKEGKAIGFKGVIDNWKNKAGGGSKEGKRIGFKQYYSGKVKYVPFEEIKREKVE